MHHTGTPLPEFIPPAIGCACSVAEGKVMPEEVLLVEDNPGDARLVREALRAANPSIRLCLTYDGVMAMTFLKQQGAYVRAPRPKLILLDLNLPRMNGREVLSLIKSDESLKSIPTIVLTT